LGSTYYKELIQMPDITDVNLVYIEVLAESSTVQNSAVSEIYVEVVGTTTNQTITNFIYVEIVGDYN